MSQEYWNVEIRRLFFAALGGVIIGYITGQYLASLLFASMVFNGWMLYKLDELRRWLVKGQPANMMPDSDGLWELVTYLLQRRKQKYEANKKKQRDLVLRFNNIMSALPDAQILINDEHIIQWANRSTEQLLGINNHRDTGQRIDNLVRVRKLTRLLNKKHKKDIRFQSPHNDSISLSARLLFVQPGLHLLNVRDISQRIHLNNMRRAFVANASHELRTPLTVMTGYLELFEEDPELPEHLLPAIRQAREQSSRMQQIIEDMLTLSHLENTERSQLAEAEIDMPKLIQDTANALQNTIASQSHSLHLSIDTSTKLIGVPKDITSVVNNLIENAVKHTPHGSSIRINWSNPDNRLCFTVEDDGPGIPSQHISHLTERFYRVDKGRSRDKGGTGLGLAIVKHVMMNHGGTLDISSEPGKTVFRACFPNSHEKLSPPSMKVANANFHSEERGEMTT